MAGLTPSAAADPLLDGDSPEATPIAFWPLASGNTDDVVGDHHLTLAGTEGVDYAWVPNRFCFPMSALEFDGSGAGYAHTTETVTPTDGSFTVTAWVYLESLTEDHQTVLSQAGIFQPAMRLQVTPDARVRFSVPTGHPNSGFGTVESEAGAVTEQVWHHLAAVLDLHAGEARVYLNGEPAGVAGAGPAPWRADGPMFIGVAGTADDASSQPIHGVIDRIGAWSSALHPDVIFSKGRTGGVPTFPCF